MSSMGVVLFIAVFSLLVIVHELGHFLSARARGIAVEEFGIGFPPRLWSIRRSGTTYSLNAIPLGGFVRLQGEEHADGRSESFLTKPVPDRMIVVASGVIMNVILAYGITVMLFSTGVPQMITEDAARTGNVKENAVTIANVLTHSPAEAAGVNINDQIQAIDGVPVNAIGMVQKLLREREHIATTITLNRNQQPLDITLRPSTIPVDPPIVGIGVELVNIGVVQYPIGQSFLLAAEMTWWQLKGVARGLSAVAATAFVERRVPDDVSGPVGIASMISQSRHQGWSNVFSLTSILSLNLAVLNLLPIPALDGGRLLFLALESLRRKRLALSIESRMHQAGFFILLLLITLVTIRDLRIVFSGISP